MKLDIKNILETYFRDHDDDASCPVCTEEEGRRSPLFAIARFIDEHHLALCPENLEVAWEYLCGCNDKFKKDLEDLIADDGLNNGSSRELYSKHFDKDIGSQIDKIVLEAIEQIRKTADLIDDGNKNTAKCETKLIEQADNIRVNKGNVDLAIQKLLDLSRLMVESTRENREQISQTNEKLAELQAELAVARSEADFDQLTRLPNRRKFERTLDAAFEKFVADKTPLVLAFVDIDHFKRINDTFGHECGDRVLRLVADELTLLADKDCHTSRYGGEEFAIIFEGEDIDTVFKKVDQCREALANRKLIDLESGTGIGKVTFSAGVAECLPSDTKQSILRKADLALYEAKSEGRNQVLKYSNAR